MKIRAISFSKYKVRLNIYSLEKMDLFSFLFTQILFNDLNKESLIRDCLTNLEIKEDLFYLFNNVYYKMIDNGIIEEIQEDIINLKIKDIICDNKFINYFKEGYFPIKENEIEKEFNYDFIKKRVTVNSIKYDDSNLVVIKVNNDLKEIEGLVNYYKKNLFNIDKGECFLKDFVVDPYYFEFELENKDNKYVCSFNNKEIIYDALVYNSLFINNKELKGDILTNNIYFKCVYGSELMSDYSDYVFVYNKEKEYETKGNLIYVGYRLNEGDFIDLTKRTAYECGIYNLEDERKVSTCNTKKIKEVSEFKLYLIKNKDRFANNISKIIDLI